MTKSTFVWFGRDTDPQPPRHSTIAGRDAARVRASLAAQLGMTDIAGAKISQAMLARSERVGTIREGERIDFEALIGVRALPTPEHVLLVWDPLQTLFKVKFADFLSALPLLFELEVYDLLVLDEELRWVVLLMHYGEIRVVSPGHKDPADTT